jgi:hypothetical protein
LNYRSVIVTNVKFDLSITLQTIILGTSYPKG